MINREHAIDIRLSTVAISARVAIGKLLAIGAVVPRDAEVDTDVHCNDMQIRYI